MLKTAVWRREEKRREEERLAHEDRLEERGRQMVSQMRISRTLFSSEASGHYSWAKCRVVESGSTL